MTTPFVPFVEQVLGIHFEPGQRVFWGVAADGWQISDLRGDDREIAHELFGDVDEITPALRRQVVVVKGADVGFSFIGGLRLLHRALTATELGAAGEIRPALAVAPDLRLGRIPIRNALGAAQAVPRIKRMIESEGADGFVIRREGGRRTSVECLPASAGGRALRGRRYLEVLFDEAAFFRDASYAVNDVDCRRAVQSRCLGTFWYGSTPWLESSDVWRTFVRNHEHPVDALAARMPTLLVRTDPRVVELVAAERDRDPEAARTEYDCEPPAGGGEFYFSGDALARCADDSMPTVLEPVRGEDIVVAAGFDPAFRRDASGGVIVRKRDGIYEVCEVFERKPSAGAPLVPSAVTREFATIAKRHGATNLMSDIHYAESIREHLQDTGIYFHEAPAGNQGKADTYWAARELINSGVVRWSAQHHELGRQLRDVIAKPSPGGLMQITSPRRRGSHGDICSAFVLALFAAANGNGLWDLLGKPDFQQAMAELSKWNDSPLRRYDYAPPIFRY